MERKRDWGNWDDLSVPEKIERVQAMWNDLAGSGADPGLTDAQREEIERRLVRHELNPGEYSSWDEIRRKIDRRG